MRPIREITAEEENFHLVDIGHSPDGSRHYTALKRDSVEPEPIGTLLLIPFQIVGYDKDCDGSLMARLKFVDEDDLEYIEVDKVDEDYYQLNRWGLYPGTELVVTPDELRELIARASKDV